MNWYKENGEEWKQIIETVSAETGKSVQMIEKDTVQSLFLRELAKTEIPFVFKGGTSLSKVYGIIDRFSEDIDLSCSRALSQSERKSTKSHIISIGGDLGLALENPQNVFSNHDYNKYVFGYKSLFAPGAEVIVETSYYLPQFPLEEF